MGLAALMYVQDYDERFVRTNNNLGAVGLYDLPNGTPSTSADMLRMYQIFPYMKNAQIFNCPSATATWSTTAYDSSGSYGYNPHMAGMAMAAVDSPSELIMMNDCTYYLGDWDTNDNGDNSDFPSIVHNEGANTVLVDGHAKWYKGSVIAYFDTADHAAPPAPDMWNP